MSTLNDLRVMRVEVQVPPSGAWFATGMLDSTSLPSGRCALVLGDLTLVGQVLRAEFEDAPTGGALVSFVARGGAGWRLPVPYAGRYASGGVRLSTVLADLARMSGETLVQPVDTSLGTGLTWEASSPAAPVHLEDVLADLVRRGYLSTWRVAPTGETRFDAWPSIGQADGRGRLTSRALSRGRRTVDLDVQAVAFLPGATIEGARIERTIFYETPGNLRAEVYTQ